MNAHESEHENEDEREVVLAIVLGCVSGNDLGCAGDGCVGQPVIPRKSIRYNFVHGILHGKR